MFVKALVDCEGLGYKLKPDEVAEVKQQIGEKLVKFGYAEEVQESEEVNTPDEKEEEMDTEPKPKKTRAKKESDE